MKNGKYIVESYRGDKVKIQIELIDDNPYQTRENFDHVEGLAKNIKEIGLINPIIVRPIEDRYQLVSGESRLRACKLLEWAEIEADLKELSDEEARVISFADNEFRKGITPIARVKAIYGFFGLEETQAEEDDKFTMTHSKIETLIKSLNKLYNDRNKDYDKELKNICDKIGLNSLNVIDALNLLSLPPILQTDKYNQSQQGLNSFVRVMKHMEKEHLKAKSNEEKSNDTQHIQSNSLKSIGEKIEKILIKKITTNKFEPGTLKKVCDALIIAPINLKLKVIEDEDQEINRNKAIIIHKVNSYSDLSESDKTDLMEDMVNTFAKYDPTEITKFIDQYRILDQDLKTSVKEHLDINVAVLIWHIRDIEERNRLVDEIITEKPSVQKSKVEKYIKEKNLKIERDIEKARMERRKEEIALSKKKEEEEKKRKENEEEIRKEKEKLLKELNDLKEKNKKEEELRQDELTKIRTLEKLEEKIKKANDDEKKKLEDEKERFEKESDEKTLKNLNEYIEKEKEKITKELEEFKIAEKERLNKIEDEVKEKIIDEVKEVDTILILDQKNRLIKKIKESSTINIKIIEKYPSQYKKEIKDQMLITINQLTNKMSEIGE